MSSNYLLINTISLQDKSEEVKKLKKDENGEEDLDEEEVEGEEDEEEEFAEGEDDLDEAEGMCDGRI